jgi:hypothetical protein
VFKVLGTDVVLPIVVGSLIIALFVAVPSYPFTRYILRRHHRKREARRRMRRAMLEAQRAASGEAPDSKSAVDKIVAVLFASMTGLFLVSCSGGDGQSSGLDPGSASSAPPAVLVACLEINDRASLFVEFPRYGNLGKEISQPGVEGEDLRHAYLRIYNFSEEPLQTHDLAGALRVESPSGSHRLEPIRSFFEEDRTGTLGLLAQASPGEELPPLSWTRVLMGYRGPAPSISGSISGSISEAQVWYRAEGEEHQLVFLDVTASDWDRFASRPELESMCSLRSQRR